MKRFISALIVCVMVICSVSALADDTWVCSNCGAESSGNFCPNCGAQKDDGTWTCPNCNTKNEGNFCMNCGTPKDSAQTAVITRNMAERVRVDVHIAFEKNEFSSTYDAKMYVNDEYVDTLPHGKDYDASWELVPGLYRLTFKEDGEDYVKGETLIEVGEDPILFSCVIHAKWDRIEVSGERVTALDGNAESADGSQYINGNLKLNVFVEFERNAMFSKYDVVMYLDDVYVTTMPHGNDFRGVLGVSPGKHTIVFYEDGNPKVKGISEFSVNGDASFSCYIEAKNNKVKVTKERIQ